MEKRSNVLPLWTREILLPDYSFVRNPALMRFLDITKGFEKSPLISLRFRFREERVKQIFVAIMLSENARYTKVCFNLLEPIKVVHVRGAHASIDYDKGDL